MAERPDRPTAHPALASTARGVLRAVVIAVSLIALLLTSSALNWVTGSHAADAPRRAVVVVGPVHGLTSRYLAYGRAMANAAEAQGMEVTRIFHPDATWRRVVRSANGAHLLIYAGHGNGWPSAFGPFQEDTKNGFGLNPEVGDRTETNVKYYGANRIRESIRLAPDAVVILSHLCYASGNASSGDPIPSRSLAVERTDNFAAGFLAAGARVVWALGWQPGADVIDALFERQATMDQVFETRYRTGVNPSNGWIGWRPATHDSVRTPGARVRVDPDPTYGYLRAITGDLSFTTDEWRTSSGGDPPPDDGKPPILDRLLVRQELATVGTAGSLPVFTPNGDGVSDTIAIRYRLSEGAYVDVEIRRANDGRVVQHMSGWSSAGRSAIVWDGRTENGTTVGDGVYRLTLTPTDRNGNVGESASIKVKSLTALLAPGASPDLFDAGDGDALAQTTAFRARLLHPGDITVLVLDAGGDVVRTGMSSVPTEAGKVRWVWDGTDDAGVAVAHGVYTGRVIVERPKGAYGHEVRVRMMPFLLDSPDWTLRRGQTVTLTITTAEPVDGKPVVTARQRRAPEQTLRVRRLSAQRFTARLTVQDAGRNGAIRLIVSSTDTAGGTQTAKILDLQVVS